jgi:hypothetical protein
MVSLILPLLHEPFSCTCIQLALQTGHWTWINGVTILVGPLSWFFFFGLQYNWDDQIFYVRSAARCCPRLLGA